MKKLAVFATLAAIVLGLIALTTAAPNAPPGEVTIAAVDHDVDLTSFQIEAAIVHDMHAAVLAEVLLELESEADPTDTSHMPMLTENIEVAPRCACGKPHDDLTDGLQHSNLYEHEAARTTPDLLKLGIALC